MRHSLLGVSLCVLPFLALAACTIPPAPGSSATVPAQVLPGDARAVAYGRTAGEVIQHPQIRDKVPALFGADWTPALFQKSGPVQMVKIAGVDYIAVTGCVPDACRTRRALLLIREGGAQFLARRDDGVIPHYYAYAYGTERIPAADAPVIVDAGLRALSEAGDPYPS